MARISWPLPHGRVPVNALRGAIAFGRSGASSKHKDLAERASALEEIDGATSVGHSAVTGVPRSWPALPRRATWSCRPVASGSTARFPMTVACGIPGSPLPGRGPRRTPSRPSGCSRRRAWARAPYCRLGFASGVLWPLRAAGDQRGDPHDLGRSSCSAGLASLARKLDGRGALETIYFLGLPGVRAAPLVARRRAGFGARRDLASAAAFAPAPNSAAPVARSAAP